MKITNTAACVIASGGSDCVGANTLSGETFTNGVGGDLCGSRRRDARMDRAKRYRGTNHRYCRLLRAGGEWTRDRRTDEKRKEFAPLHCHPPKLKTGVSSI